MDLAQTTRRGTPGEAPDVRGGRRHPRPPTESNGQYLWMGESCDVRIGGWLVESFDEFAFSNVAPARGQLKAPRSCLLKPPGRERERTV